MKTKRDVMRLAKRLGATVSINANPPRLDVGVEAPRGSNWSCDPGVHELVRCQWDDDTPADVWTDLWERMDLGIEFCIYGDACDWCVVA